MPGRLHVGLKVCEVLKNAMRAFSNKSGLNNFYEKNGRFALVSVNSSRAFSSRVIKKTFLPYIKPVTQGLEGVLRDPGFGRN